MLDFVAAHVDHAQMGFKVTDRLEQSFQENVLRRLDIRSETAGKQRNTVVKDDHNALRGENKDAHGLDFEQEIILGGIVLGIFQDHRRVIVFKLNTGRLVGVGGRQQRMFIHTVVIDEMVALRLIRQDIDFNLREPFRSLGDPSIDN